jgi:hypothetical protein
MPGRSVKSKINENPCEFAPLLCTYRFVSGETLCGS